ncbi:hypothetical protein Tco_0795943 [Tanacetum coccineum]
MSVTFNDTFKTGIIKEEVKSRNSCLSERDDDDDTELSESIPLVFNDMIFENSNNNSHTFCWTISDNEAYAMDEDNEEHWPKTSLHESSNDDGEGMLNRECDTPSSLPVRFLLNA